MTELVAEDSPHHSAAAFSYATLSSDSNAVDLAVADTLVLKSWRRQLRRHSPIKRKTTLVDINKYRKDQDSPEEALLNIIQEKDRISYPEERIIAYVTEYILEGANIECTDVYGNTPLHQAAWMGFPDLTKELLQRGADVHALNCDAQTPMEVAISRGLELDDERTEDYSRVAALVIKEMEPSKVRELFHGSPTEICKLKFRELVCRQDMQEAADAVLDTLIERISEKAIKVHYSLLEASDNGEVQLENCHRRSTLKYIVDIDNKDILIHPAVTLLIESKMRRFARNELILRFIYWAVTMTVLSVALILGAKSTDAMVYAAPVDYFRALCEGLMLLLITISFIWDIPLIYVVRLRFFTEYKFFIFTYFNILTAVLLYVYIILHAVKVQERWFIASIAFVVYALRGFRFLLTIRFISKYVLILAKIIKHDIFTFLGVFTVVLFATTGGLYIEERLFVSNSTLTYDFPSLALIGIRMMVEGDKIIDYTRFHWLGYGTYLIFMFFVVVVLQSLLIAQMSDTFTNVQVDAKRALILNRARTILNVEETTNTLKSLWISKLLKAVRIKLTVLTEEVWEDPAAEKLLEKVELPESIIIVKTLTKLEKMMTTQRELVEELRDCMMAEQRKLINSLKSIIGEPE